MKTIFDKIDPKYIECTAGACEHGAHMLNGALVTASIVCYILTKMYLKTQEQTDN